MGTERRTRRGGKQGESNKLAYPLACSLIRAPDNLTGSLVVSLAGNEEGWQKKLRYNKNAILAHPLECPIAT